MTREEAITKATKAAVSLNETIALTLKDGNYGYCPVAYVYDSKLVSAYVHKDGTLHNDV